MKFILILFGIFLLFRYIFPLILRIAVGKVLAKTQQQYQQGRNPYQGSQQTSSTPPPAASTNTSGKKPIIDDDQGEYVDYVEVK
jgi:Domain of unknown function (DUF4834)